jgi:hypothetical protein
MAATVASNNNALFDGGVEADMVVLMAACRCKRLGSQDETKREEGVERFQACFDKWWSIGGVRERL